MACKNTKPRAQTYSMLTDVQKDILTRHYDGGMVGTGRRYDEMITRAAEETNLPRDKVEVSLRRSLTLFLLPVHSEQFGQILADLYGEKWEAFSGIMCEAEGRSYRKWFKMCNVD